MTAIASRLALGTVQFGMPYGVANRAGQVPPQQAAEILKAARAAGVDTLDTAVAYGDSERVLGHLGVPGWRVVSKLPPCATAGEPLGEWVRRTVLQSLRRLRIPSLHAVLLHRAADLSESRGADVFAALTALREEGHIEAIGVSIYDPSELEAILSQHKIELVQTPFNIVDRRIVDSGWLHRLRDAGIKVHARSAFLQGLLLMNVDARPAYFANWAPLWRRWEEWVTRSGMTALQACLAFVASNPDIERVVVGFDGVDQLREALSVSVGAALAVPRDLASLDIRLLNPSLWPRP